ncbi:MAG: hypothetical protein H5U40_15220, partial [Polyangiaceae bacterium]|nr:hypothetical protein [Polyangiaceae bacterium]
MSRATEELVLPGAYGMLLIELVGRWHVTPDELLEGLDISVEELSASGARVRSQLIGELIARAIKLTG